MSYEGKVVLNYKLTKKLGEGGFGAVYLAEQVDLGRRAAIKILHHQFASQPAVVERFFREARAVCDIGHRTIVAIENFGRLPETDEPFYLMEFFPGGSLTQIASDRWLTSEQLVAILDPIVDALSAAHAKGIIHRDLKPDNIMVRIANDKVADVRLLDFGIAKLLDGDVSHSMTGSAMGTPSYMPPEQALDAKNVDVRADVYSFGATVYAAVCGRPPFDGSSVAAILLAVQIDVAAPLSTLRPDCTPELDAAIRRCLAKSRDHRPPSIADAWAQIRTELVRSNLTATPQQAIPAIPPTVAHVGPLVTPAPMAVLTPAPGHAPPQITQHAPLATPVPEPVMARPAIGADQAATTPEVRARSKRPLVLGIVGLVAVFGIVVAIVAGMSSKSGGPSAGSGSGSPIAGSGSGSVVATATPDQPADAGAMTVAPTRLEPDEVIGPVSRFATAQLAACGAKPDQRFTSKVTYRIDINEKGRVTWIKIDGATSAIAECVRKAIEIADLGIRTSPTGGAFVVVIDIPVASKPPGPKPPDPKPPDPKPPDPKPPGGACSEASFSSIATTATDEGQINAALKRLEGCRSKLAGATFQRLQQALVKRQLQL